MTPLRLGLGDDGWEPIDATVAQGVETRAQAEVLATLGCHLAQGFCYAAPRDPIGMSQRLARERPLFHAAAGG